MFGLVLESTFDALKSQYESLQKKHHELIAAHETLLLNNRSLQSRLDGMHDFERTQAALATKRDADFKAYADARDAEFKALMERAAEFKTTLEKDFLAGRNWLANAFAEFVDNQTVNVQRWLQTKTPPAYKAAEAVSVIRQQFRRSEGRRKQLQLQLESYEEYFPFLVEYRDAILAEAIDLRDAPEESLQQADPVLAKGWLNKTEYDTLPQDEKFQLALDRWWEHQKPNWEIGKIYEQYIGMRYETDGWDVTYHGINEGRADLGRDLICVKHGATHVVQCKCWSGKKVIREKHIMQLYGTVVLMRAQRQANAVCTLFDFEDTITPVFMSTTLLSDEARMVAQHLKVEVHQQPLIRFPLIKCNISTLEGEKIFHLPMDQQYDNVKIDRKSGEFYASSVSEAMSAGFRRARRWRSSP